MFSLEFQIPEKSSNLICIPRGRYEHNICFDCGRLYKIEKLTKFINISYDLTEWIP